MNVFKPTWMTDDTSVAQKTQTLSAAENHVIQSKAPEQINGSCCVFKVKN